MAKSIFEIISENIVENDHLPEDFSLANVLVRDGGDSVLPWADGAKDGVMLYHTQGAKNVEEALDHIDEAIQAASAGDEASADENFAKLGHEFGALALIDVFQQYLADDAVGYDAEKVFSYSVHAIMDSDDRETVKFGLEIQEILRSDDEQIKNMIRTVALSDEFALYCFYIMKNWENGDTDIMEAGRRLHGWGRIHAVTMIEPRTAMIRAWLLREAVENNVDPNYSAFQCFEKSGTREKLKREISQEEFVGIGKILRAILAKGPNGGMENLRDSEEVVRDYVKQALSKDLTKDDYETLWSLGILVSDNRRARDISKNIEKIITDPKCKAVMGEMS